MNFKKILLAEDDNDFANLIKTTLEDNGFPVEIANNGKIALDLFVETRFSVIIVDINMPVMSGDELARKIKEIDNNAIIIVQTGRAESEFIIDIMKIGVFDYMIKPVNLNDLIFKVKRAFEHYELISAKETLIREKELRFENQLNWFRYKERLLNIEEFENKNNFFNRLYTSFNQGSGIGAVYSLMTIIISSAEICNDNYVISSKLVDMLKKSVYLINDGMSLISEIDAIMNGDIITTDLNISNFYEMIKEILDNIKEKIAIKDNTFIFSKEVNAPKRLLRIDIDLMKKALTEIITNSLKFSVIKSKIIVLYGIEENYFQITIINEPDPIGDIIGIPKEYESLIFEPFFRISKFVYENYSTFDYGLGLTYCEKILQKHKGTISLSNINDRTNLEKTLKIKVKTEVKIPLYQSD